MSKRLFWAAVGAAAAVALGASAGVGVASHGSDHNGGTTSTASPSQPQPLSGADQNSGGANGQCPGGPYCSTRDGSPSQNGSGNGNATGEPCAGCVGKADNKNPQGQMPNGSDRNAGYECDRNNGIGKTNPAHTGCTSTSSTTTTSSSNRQQQQQQQQQGQATQQTSSVSAATQPAAPGAPATPVAQGQVSGVLGAAVTKQVAATPKTSKPATLPARHAVARAPKPATAQPSFTG